MGSDSAPDRIDAIRGFLAADLAITAVLGGREMRRYSRTVSPPRMRTGEEPVRTDAVRRVVHRVRSLIDVNGARRRVLPGSPARSPHRCHIHGQSYVRAGGAHRREVLPTVLAQPGQAGQDDSSTCRRPGSAIGPHWALRNPRSGRTAGDGLLGSLASASQHQNFEIGKRQTGSGYAARHRGRDSTRQLQNISTRSRVRPTHHGLFTPHRRGIEFTSGEVKPPVQPVVNRGKAVLGMLRHIFHRESSAVHSHR